jgi:Mn-dependent DtxR family transcriptional regulator
VTTDTRVLKNISSSEKVNFTKISRELGVSRITVKNSIKRLEAWGLVVLKSGTNPKHIEITDDGRKVIRGLGE